MTALFSAAVLASAFLLFLVQPMFAKMALPLLGGSPSVWTTCMLFFQAVLLAGYLYAHISVRLLGVRRQAMLHALLALVPLLVLPIAIDDAPAVDGASAPTGWLLGVMLTSVGAPLFLLSTLAPLIQRWFSVARHRSAADPYFLYAASNTGSLAALLLYPAVVEPLLSMRNQQLLWAAGYVVTVLLVLACALVAYGSRDTGETSAGAAAPPLSSGRQVRWVALAFAPSALMLAVTAHISTDIAAVPLLWIVPLVLYLSTFIIAFSPGAEGAVRVARRVLPLLLLPLILFLLSQAGAELWFILPLHLGTFWMLSLLCHGELARDRPLPSHLTTFYVWMAVGGALGGLFNTFVAPALFVRVPEYPILIAATVLILAGGPALQRMLREPRAVARAAAAPLLAAAALGLAWSTDMDTRILLVLLAPALVAAFTLSRLPGPFAIAIVLLLALSVGSAQRFWGRVLYAERTFFGLYRVVGDADRRLVSLFHGTTLHGSQSAEWEGHGPEPLTYYHHGSPISDLFTREPARDMRSVGVVGLGVGSLAAYAAPGQRWTFYEIDPVVERIARDTRYFNFLQTCGSACGVVIGDGRLALAAHAETHDLLVLDAFSSDAIPVHLLTREAMRTYLAHLSARGIMAFHISNRHFDLAPVLARLAADQRLVAFTRLHDAAGTGSKGFSSSRWVAAARSRSLLKDLVDTGGWSALQTDGRPVWTDDFSNVWSALQWWRLTSAGMPDG